MFGIDLIIYAIVAVVSLAGAGITAGVQSKGLNAQIGVTKELALMDWKKYLKEYNSDQQFRFFVIFAITLLLIGLIMWSIIRKA